MLPSIAVTPRVGSFALALVGSTRNVQEAALLRRSARVPAGSLAGRRSFALKRIAEAVFAILLDNINSAPAKQQLLMLSAQDSCLCLDLHSIFSYRSAILHQ